MQFNTVQIWILNILIKVNTQEREKSTKKTLEEPGVAFEDAADGVRDQVGEGEVFQDPVHTTRLKVRHFLIFIKIIFTFSAARE